MPTANQFVLLGILAVTIALFWTERLRAELVALLGMVALMVSGLVTPEEGVSGFSHPATMTVMALFILTAGVSRSGAIASLGAALARWTGQSEFRVLLILFLLAAPTSAFLNNTAIVAILIPLALALASHARVSPSRLLMPLSQFAMLAGTVTLIGTSPNLLASALTAERTGQPFELFQFTRIGLLVLAAGAAYVFLVGRHLIPRRVSPAGPAEQGLLDRFTAEVRVKAASPLIGRSATEHAAFRPGRLDLLHVLRGGKPIAAGALVEEGDILAIRSPRGPLTTLEAEAGVEILTGVNAQDIKGESDQVAEVIVAPASSLVRRPITEGWIARSFGVKVLGIAASPRPGFGFGFATRLRYGDTLLVAASEESLQRIRGHPDFIVASAEPSKALRPWKAALAVGIMASVVGLAASGVMSILVAALAGAVVMVLVRVLKPDDLWSSVRWDVIFLLAGMIPFGLAMVNTGLADAVGSFVASAAQGLPGIGIIAMFYAASLLLTMVLSNAGTVILMVPVAFSSAAQLGVSPLPMVVATMFAASNEFLTPIGYQTNLMVYGPGGYRFSDYARAGALLALVAGAVACYAIAAWIPF